MKTESFNQKLRGVSRILVLIAAWTWTTNCDELPTAPSSSLQQAPTVSMPVPHASTQVGNAIDIGNLGFSAPYGPLLDDQGQVAGTMYVSPNVLGIAQWNGQDLQALDVSELGCTTAVIGGLGSNGELAGTASDCADQSTFAFRWNPAAGIRVLKAPDPIPGNPATYTAAYGFNNHGNTAGAVVDSDTKRYPARWDGLTGLNIGEYAPLPFVNPSPAEPMFINDQRQITGRLLGTFPNGKPANRTFIWSPGGLVQDIGILGAGDVVEPTGLNDDGIVIGNANTVAGGQIHAFRWTESSGMQDLGTFGGAWSRAYAINNSGVIVGSAMTVNTERAFRWTMANGLEELPLPPGRSVARDINESGVITGEFTLTVSAFAFQIHAFRWSESGGFEDLGTLGGIGSRGESINEAGQVAGTWTPSSGGTRWARWDAAIAQPPVLPIPQLVPQLSGGDALACALKTDGTVACWGENAIQPPAGSTFVQISSGGLHSCGLKSDGTVLCWGENNFGQNDVPQALMNAVQVAAGYNHTCALRNTGTVTCWGQNTIQQLDSAAAFASVTQISTSASTTCARKSDGKVVCWGDNGRGQGSVPANTTADQVVAGGFHTCAILNGNASCWGANELGQSQLPTVAGTAAKYSLGYYFTCRLNNGVVNCFGDNSRAQTTVPQLSNSVQGIAAGGYHGCAFDSDGVITCWGAISAPPVGLNILGKQSQTINFTSTAPNPGFVGGTYNVSATGGASGNPVLFTSLTPSVCDVSGNSVSLNGVGDCTIAANQAGNAQYVAASQVTQTFSVVPALERVASVGAGDIHSCVLKPDGGIVCWGVNDNRIAVPSGLNDVVQLSVGTRYNCVLRVKSTVTCWGVNGFGETIPPANLTGVIQVSAGGKMTCALKFDKTVLCWGSDTDGELNVPAGMQALQVSAGGDAFGCALKTDHTVACWGFSSDGRTTVPQGVINVQQLSAGSQHACALTSSGTVACWGPNPDGRTSIPQGLSNVTQVSAGGGHTCALKSEGTVTCWGSNSDGQASPPANLASVEQISSGVRHTCARRADGKIICWGRNDFGQTNVPVGLAPLYQSITFNSTPPVPANVGGTYSVVATGGGSGNPVTFSSTTVSTCSVNGGTVSLISAGTCTIAANQAGGNGYDPAPQVTQSFNVIVPLVIPALAAQVTSGGFHTCAARIDGNVSCWGRDIDGQATVPATLTSAARISGGGYHNCAIMVDGTVRCWGLNNLSQSTPPGGLSSVAKISAGSFHTCAIKTDASLVCWGWNGLGQISIPANLGAVMDVGSGDRHTCAVKVDGTVACWGSNETNQVIVPAGLNSVVQVASGSYHSCALKSDGTVVCWGENGHGQLSIPPSLNSVVEIAMGARYSCARKSDGSIVCWGSNDESQQNIPLSATSLTQISTGYFHTCALKSDGTPLCWGGNADGQSAVPASLNLNQRLQTITFSSAPNPAALGTSFTASATGGGSGNAVTFTSLTTSTCTVSGSQVSLIALGTCTIAADQAGAEGFAPALQKTQSFEVSSPFNMLSRCGHAITGIAFDGTDYFVGEGHNSLDQCITRYSQSGVLKETKHFQVDIRGLHYVPASGSLTSRTWAGPIFSMNYGAGTQQQFTGFVAAQGADQSQPAVDPDGTAFWVLNVPSQLAELHRVSDNGIVRSFSVTGGLASAPAIAVSNALVFVPNGTTVRGYDKITGDLVSTITLPTSSEGCSGYGFGASFSGDRLMYSETCSIAHVHLITPPGMQTIQFTSNPPASPMYGGSYTVSATGGASGNAVTFTSETQSVCTVNGSLVTFGGVGTCTIAAHQAGGSNYLHATDLTQSFNVAKAPQVVTFSSNPATPAILGGSYTPSATSNVGLPVSYGAFGSCTFDGTTVRLSIVGQCTVQAVAAGSAVYLSGSTTQSFNVFYQFTGFAAPILNAPSVNSIAAGTVIKVKFSLGGYYGLDVIANGSPTIGVLTTPCNTAGTPATTVPVTFVDFKYDGAAGQYVYSGATESSWAGSCRQFKLQLRDGSVHLAHFQFDSVTKASAVLTVSPTTVTAAVPTPITYAIEVASPTPITGISGIPCTVPSIPSGATTYNGSCTRTMIFNGTRSFTTATISFAQGPQITSNTATIQISPPPPPTVQLTADRSSIPTNSTASVQMTLSISSVTPIASIDVSTLAGSGGTRCTLSGFVPRTSTTYNGSCSFTIGPYAKATKLNYVVGVTVDGLSGTTQSNTVTINVTK